MVQTTVSSNQTDHEKYSLECKQVGVSNLWPMGHKQLQIAMKGPMVLRSLEINWNVTLTFLGFQLAKESL